MGVVNVWLHVCSSSTGLLELLVSGELSGMNDAQVGVVQLTVDQLIRKTVMPTNIAYAGSVYVNTMMDIFNRLILDSSFNGRSRLAESMKSLAYSLLEDVSCQSEPLIYLTDSFYLQAERLAPSSLAGRRFSSSNGQDYVQFPTGMILSTQVSLSQLCVAAGMHVV